MRKRNVTAWPCVLGLLLASSVARSQTQVEIAPVPKLQFLDVNGKPLAGGCVFTYAAGTTTPQATYTDATGATQNTNPVILDSGGRASIWLSSSAYKIAVWSSGGVACASGVQQYSIDGITVANLNSANQVISAAANPAATGFIRMANGDLMNWRNIANSADIGFSQAGAATTANGNLADVLRYGSATAGGLQAQRYLDFSTAPAQSGVLATGNNICAIASRNAAGNGDVCVALVDGSNVENLGGTTGVKLVGPLNISSGSETLGGETFAHQAHFFCSGFTTAIAATNAFQRCYADQAVTIIALDYNTNSTPGAGCSTQPTIDVIAQGQTSQQLTLTNGNAFGDTTITPFNVNAGQAFALRVEVGPVGCSTSWTNVQASATVREQ